MTKNSNQLFEKIYEKSVLFLELSRLKKPIGIWLLFLPCLFGVTFSYKFNEDFDLWKLILLFFFGSVLMRSAGCIINDIMDRKIDVKVKRTKNRPIALGKITLYEALIFLTILLILSLWILLQFNQLSICLGFGVMVLVVLYPLTKRITYYPQLFLGITFNFGIILAGAQILGEVNYNILLLYGSCIFWTLIYDTIYAYQDIEDDIVSGVRSSAVKFGKNPRLILYIFAVMQMALLFLLGYLANFYLIYYLLIYVALFHSLCQIKICNFDDVSDCLAQFKHSAITGVIILMALFLG